jgi:hypothetical protein
MKEPEVDKVLMSFSGTLLTKIMPHLSSEYAQKDLTLIALALNGAAEEYDRAAENRMAENRAMRAIFEAAAPLIDDAELKARMEAASQAEPKSLRIRDLNAANSMLSEALIELQKHVELQQGDAWHAIEEQLWTELKARGQRRAIAFFPF